MQAHPRNLVLGPALLLQIPELRRLAASPSAFLPKAAAAGQTTRLRLYSKLQHWNSPVF